MENEKDIKWWKSKTQNIVAFMALVFMFSFLTLLIFVEIPASNRDIVNILITLIFPPLLASVIWYLFNYRKLDADSSITTVTQTSQVIEPKHKIENE
jgi:hypothetical protein